MSADKEIKKQFKVKASKSPDQYYATAVLKQEGFVRKKCENCGTFFWSVTETNFCGKPECSGGFRFIGNTPAKKELDYIGVWNAFAKHFRALGYTPIKRYPVVARWRTDTDFVQASIYDFQPYVISGEVEPPANPLVVPQFCLRFNDIDNVGITGAHYTGFVMIGQHAFMPPEKWDQAQYFRDIHSWLVKGLGLRKEEVTYHEDAWAGGGNFGPCMEFFSRGLELGNQVYMQYAQTPSGPKELQLKVLDMGMGHERNAWFTQGKATSYETTFPPVCENLFKATGVKTDPVLMRKFLPYAAYLNVDEVEDIDKVWKMVAEKIQHPMEELREGIQQLAALFSIAEHSRALLVALSDGALPSNVGGGYNLRVILRRALSFIDKYNWNIDLKQVTEWHAAYLKKLFPELQENLDEVHEILDVEKAKYEATKQKTRQIVEKVLQERVTEKQLLELYDSHGIAPELVQEEVSKLGKEITVPEDFYARVAELHEQKEQTHATKREEELDLKGLPETRAKYFEDYKKHQFKAKVVKIIGKNIVLDETYFYPTSGGQLHDLGTLQGQEVVDVFKQGKYIVHLLAEAPKFKEGDVVEGIIDKERRIQLAQHHTATHILNAAARKVLGKHINQASAKKDVEKAHLDITHYDSLTEEELKKIEQEANRIVKEKIPVYSKFVPRTKAEQEYGMTIYQGGVVPGKELRIVDIAGQDVEACGGTHLKNTSEARKIKILKATKISDGIVRITFTAGKAAEKEQAEEQQILEKAAALLGGEPAQVPARVQELFEKWKTAVKKKKAVERKALMATEAFRGTEKEILMKTCEILKTQPEHVVKTIKRFKEQLEEA